MKEPCRNKDIREQLPAYREQLLDADGRSLVEGHLADCADCARELELLRVLAEETVPDPGEAFWAALPGRVFRDVAEQEQQRRSGLRSFLPDWLLLPRWTWAGAAAAVLLVAAAAWFLVRPEPLEIASTAAPDSISSSDDMLDAESIDMAELDDVQLESLDSWASRELAALQDGISDLFTNGLDASTDDRLAELDAQELERLSDSLDEYEYEEEG